MAGRAAGILVSAGGRGEPAGYPLFRQWWNTLHGGSTQMQQSIDGDALTARWAIAGYLLLCFA